MLSHTLAVLVVYLAVVSSRETIRPMPTITNSLVNLGKMEISFYFNGNGHDTPPRVPDHSPAPSSPFFFPKPEPILEEPCSTFRNDKDSFVSNPTGLLNKMLMNNDLFSFHKDPVSSTLCCDSHERLQEGTVVFEFPPNQKTLKPSPARSNSLPMIPFLFDSIIPNKSMLPPLKKKAIEIFLFPKKKEMGAFDMPKFQPKKKEVISKESITIVGDKKLENNIDLFKPALPLIRKHSIVQDKIKKESENDKPAEVTNNIIVEPANKPNSV